MNFDTKYWHLTNHQLFKDLNRDEMKKLCLISNFKTAKKGETIHFDLDSSQRIYTIKKGSLKIISTTDIGDESVKDVLSKGDLFGHFDLDNEDINEHAVVLSESLTCCSFKVDDFEKILTNNPALSLRYTKFVGFKLKRIQNRYSNLMYKDVKTRLSLFLKDWIEKEAPEQSQNITIKNYLTHQDIANLICSTRQTVTQLLNDLKNNNIIDYNRTEITVFELNKL